MDEVATVATVDHGLEGTRASQFLDSTRSAFQQERGLFCIILHTMRNRQAGQGGLDPRKNFDCRTFSLSFSSGSIAWTRYRRPSALPQHSHRAVNICLVTDGTGRERIGQRVHNRETGELLFYPAQAEHAAESVCPMSGFLNMEFTAEEAMLDGLPGGICNRWPERTGSLLRAFRRELALGDTLTPLGIEALVWECLDRFRSPAPRRRRQLPGRVASVRTLLDASFRRPPTMAEITTELGGDPTNLARSFRKWIGRSIGEYVRTLRLAEARTILRKHPEFSIAQVALQCGYSDQAHMTRSFARTYGTTPAKFRMDNL